MDTRTFEIRDEQFEVRPVNSKARMLWEKSLLKQNIAKDSVEGAVEFARILLVSWKKDGKDLIQIHPREKVRDLLSEYDAIMIRIVDEAKSLADETNAIYETDRKN